MCKGFREEIAIEGSFCRCRNGSPPGHWVPVTIFTLGPATWDQSEPADRDANKIKAALPKTGIRVRDKVRVKRLSDIRSLKFNTALTSEQQTYRGAPTYRSTSTVMASACG